MDRRLPARVLALLALVGVSVALFVVVSGATEAGNGAGSSPATSTTEEGTPASGAGDDEAPRQSGRRRYTVRAGDTASGIAEKTGVPVERLLDLNPDVDPQALQTGQRLKLR